MSDFDRYADKVQLIERLRQSGLENAARAFRDRTRTLLRTDRYRKSVSREMSWFLLEAAVETLLEVPDDPHLAEAKSRYESTIKMLGQMADGEE